MHACVCVYEWEVTGSDSTQAKRFIPRHHWTWGDTTDSPLTWLGMTPAATKVSCLKNKTKRQGRIRLNCTTYNGGLENARGVTFWSHYCPRCFQKEAILF